MIRLTGELCGDRQNRQVDLEASDCIRYHELGFMLHVATVRVRVRLIHALPL
jgi:hypothetical protein